MVHEDLADDLVDDSEDFEDEVLVDDDDDEDDKILKIIKIKI